MLSASRWHCPHDAIWRMCFNHQVNIKIDTVNPTGDPTTLTNTWGCVPIMLLRPAVRAIAISYWNERDSNPRMASSQFDIAYATISHRFQNPNEYQTSIGLWRALMVYKTVGKIFASHSLAGLNREVILERLYAWKLDPRGLGWGSLLSPSDLINFSNDNIKYSINGTKTPGPNLQSTGRITIKHAIIGPADFI